MKEHFLKHVICDWEFLWLPFPEVNDADTDKPIWYQLKGNNFSKRWEHKKKLVEKNLSPPKGNKIFSNG